MDYSHFGQIIIAILFILFLAFIAYVIYNREILNNISNSGSTAKEIVMFKGIMDLSRNNYKFETYNKTASSFKDLTPSVNQNGGAEYSYNFWLYKTLSDVTSNNDIVLLLRGDTIKVPYLNKTNCRLQKNANGEYIVKNPLIRMKSNGDAIIVEYNTITSPDAYREYGKNAIDCSNPDWVENNKGHLGIYDLDKTVYNGKWFMFTLVLQETSPENDILNKNKTICKIYINGNIVLDRIVESPYGTSYGSSVMKHNRGKLYVNPESLSGTGITEDNLKMADLSYFNYAVDTAEISEMFKKGFVKSEAIVATDAEDDIRNSQQIAVVNDDNLPSSF